MRSATHHLAAVQTTQKKKKIHKTRLGTCWLRRTPNARHFANWIMANLISWRGNASLSYVAFVSVHPSENMSLCLWRTGVTHIPDTWHFYNATNSDSSQCCRALTTFSEVESLGFQISTLPMQLTKPSLYPRKTVVLRNGIFVCICIIKENRNITESMWTSGGIL